MGGLLGAYWDGDERLGDDLREGGGGLTGVGRAGDGGGDDFGGGVVRCCEAFGGGWGVSLGLRGRVVIVVATLDWAVACVAGRRWCARA